MISAGKHLLFIRINVAFLSILAVDAAAEACTSNACLQDGDEAHFMQKHLESWIQPTEPGKKYEEIGEGNPNHIGLHAKEATSLSSLSPEVAFTGVSRTKGIKMNDMHPVEAISPSKLFVEFTGPKESDDLQQGEQPVYSVEDLSGCPACDGQSHETCGRCIRLGYNHWVGKGDTDAGSRLFEVQNVMMVNGTALWIGEHADKISECGNTCSPTWELWPSDGHSWSEYAGQPLNSDHTDPHYTPETESCSAKKMVTQPALITNWFFPDNAYHFYMQNVFPTFMTLAHLAEMQGCTGDRIEVYLNSGWRSENRFKPLWDAFAKISGPMSDMNGCYRQVFFGQMAYDYLNVGTWNMYAPILSTWMTAYRMNARSLLVSDVATSGAAADPLVFLHVAHNRAPPWTKDITWSVDGVEIRPIDFAELPIHEQFAQAAKANGFIGIGGSGLAQQIFLPIGSSILQVTPLQTSNEIDSLGQGVCGAVMDDLGTMQHEDASRCYGNTAIHIGNSLLNWRWCRLNIWNDTAAFSSEDAQAVVKLLLSEAQAARASQTARLCTVFNDKSLVESWPRCDSLLVAPILQPSRRCGEYGIMGTPFGPQENRTVTQYCTGDGHCY